MPSPANLLSAPIAFDFEGTTFSITDVGTRPETGTRTKKSRAYSSESYGVRDTWGEMPEYSIRGENKDLDRAWDAYNKRIKKFQLAAFRVLHDRGILPGLFPYTFSRYAGCSCPCSPGVIAGGMVKFTDKRGGTARVSQISVKREGDKY